MSSALDTRPLGTLLCTVTIFARALLAGQLITLSEVGVRTTTEVDYLTVRVRAAVPADVGVSRDKKRGERKSGQLPIINTVLCLGWRRDEREE